MQVRRGESLKRFFMVDVGFEPTTQKPHGLSTTPFVNVLGVDTECPLQVYQLSRSLESTHFRFLRRDVAFFDSTRAPDSFRDRRHVPPIYFLPFPNIKRQPHHTKTIQMISNSDNYVPPIYFLTFFPEYKTPTLSYESHPNDLKFG